MRKDMPKKFLESGKGPKGRFPRNCKNLSLKDEDGQNVHNPHGMKKAHRYTIKYEEGGDIGTDFAVLRRFLQSRIGQPWDKVYSEVCAEADYRSFKGHHLREWLEYEVEQNCYMEDSNVIDQRGVPLGRSWRWGEFYVHPVTGNLEYTQVEHSRQKRPVEKKIFEYKNVQYCHHKGIWYRVKMADVPIVEYKGFGGRKYQDIDHWAALKDVMLDLHREYESYSVRNKLIKTYGRSPKGKVWHCVWKQSANSKEIANLKKMNQAAA